MFFVSKISTSPSDQASAPLQKVGCLRMQHKNKMVTPYLKYFLALLLFGSNGLIASSISLSSYEIVFLRTWIGSLLLLLLFVFSHQKFSFYKHKPDMFFLAASGIAMGASWMFLYEAYQQVGVSLASLAYYCGPVLVMVLSPLLFHEALTWSKGIGFAAVLLGIFLVNGKALSQGNVSFGLFCGGMSAVMYAAMVICNKRAARISGLENASIQLFISFFTVAVFVGVKQGFRISVPSADWIPILILGLLNTGVGCYLYFSAIGRLPVQTVAVCGYLEPLSAVLLSVCFLKETLLPAQIAGAVLILGGAAFGEWFGIPKKLGTNRTCFL